MVSLLTAAGGIWAAMIASALAIDFTPHENVREFEGTHFSELIFADDAFDVTYKAPPGWTYEGSGNTFTVQPPKKDQADMKIVASRTDGTPVVLDDAGTKAYLARAQAMLPRGSQDAHLVSQAVNAVMVNGHNTYEATFTYGFFGQKFETCILFAFLDKEQFTVQISAHPGDFDDVYRAAHASLFSFQWVKPKA